MNRRSGVCLAVMTTVLLLATMLSAGAASVAKMGTDELNTRLGEEGLIVLDVRASGDWASSSEKVRGAVRVDSGLVSQWRDNYRKGSTIVLYCS